MMDHFASNLHCLTLVPVNGLRCYDLLGGIRECDGVCARIKALESGTSTEGDYVSKGGKCRIH